ncbi:Crp/Fnr family transcriptional regulator [Sporolactobacillus terrae]|uniref:Crp/Fnr family transcriptional regulator n=2 Tax=Sporolactobacillus terrae TaxID=269673 RepID=A0ABX5QA58_9BACL|nr:Crp/Fnr family transcriptional regulator [Sporolactobacillus terrae]QAA23504.1 Crp/Fnr family transcriptional regulator [Sporolactobacillus terrae]QAA26474.1 Crp/Fnr family transcriptional regulator [Sporolactobacillus terrae]
MMGKHSCLILVPLFNHLDESDLEKIDQLTKRHVYKKAEQIFKPYDQKQLTIVAKGRMKVYQISGSGREQLLRVVEPGGYEGETALFGTENDSSFGEALQETVVCTLAHQDFRKLLLTYPQISLKLLETNAEKLVSAENQSKFLLMEAVETRLAVYLLDLAKAKGSLTFDLPVKMKELAGFLGTTPETLSRKFKLLKDKALIHREKQTVTLLDPEELEARYVIN